MKKVLFFLFFLLVPLAFAIYGGDNYTFDFEYCDNLTVIIDGDKPIDNEEYIVNEECVEYGNNRYNCSCNDDWTFTLQTKLNTINNYDIRFDYDYTAEEESSSSDGGGSSSGGGGSSSSFSTKCGNYSLCINRTQFKTCNKSKLVYNVSRSCVPKYKTFTYNQTNTTPLEQKPIIIEQQPTTEPIKVTIEDNSTFNFILWGIVIILILGGGIFWFIKMNRE